MRIVNVFPVLHQMRLQVLISVPFLHKRLRAHITRVRAIPRMNFEMLLEGILRLESLAANVATELTVAGVDEIVLVKVCFEGEGSETHSTNVWFLAYVEQVVFLEVGFRREPLVADVADVVEFLSGVDVVVLVEVGLQRERPSADGARVGFDPRVYQLVLLLVLLGRETFPAVVAVEHLLQGVVDSVVLLEVFFQGERFVADCALVRFGPVVELDVFLEVGL